MVTVEPPGAGPLPGLSIEMTGGPRYVRWAAVVFVLVPVPLVTVISTVPEPGGTTAPMSVGVSVV
jgi:hypothetical protein